MKEVEIVGSQLEARPRKKEENLPKNKLISKRHVGSSTSGRELP
jgi:hypothetical protein